MSVSAVLHTFCPIRRLGVGNKVPGLLTAAVPICPKTGPVGYKEKVQVHPKRLLMLRTALSSGAALPGAARRVPHPASTRSALHRLSGGGRAAATAQPLLVAQQRAASPAQPVAMAAGPARSRRVSLNHLDSYCGRSVGEVTVGGGPRLLVVAASSSAAAAGGAAARPPAGPPAGPSPPWGAPAGPAAVLQGTRAGGRAVSPKRAAGERDVGQGGVKIT